MGRRIFISKIANAEQRFSFIIYDFILSKGAHRANGCLFLWSCVTNQLFVSPEMGDIPRTSRSYHLHEEDQKSLITTITASQTTIMNKKQRQGVLKSKKCSRYTGQLLCCHENLTGKGFCSHTRMVISARLLGRIAALISKVERHRSNKIWCSVTTYSDR